MGEGKGGGEGDGCERENKFFFQLIHPGRLLQECISSSSLLVPQYLWWFSSRGRGKVDFARNLEETNSSMNIAKIITSSMKGDIN